MGGGRDSLVLCGDKATTWERLHRVYHNFQILEWKSWLPRDEELTAAVRLELQSAEPAIYDAYRAVEFWKWKKGEDIRFLQDSQMKGQSKANQYLLDRCRVALCSNPLDKVYGILSLLSNTMAAKITPDYNCDVRHVFMDFTRAWIESEGTLVAFTEVGSSGEHYKRDRTIPSWAIDLRQETKQKILEVYSADGQKNAPVSFIRNGTVLSTKGVLFDTVDGTSGLRHWKEDYNNATDIIQNSTYHTNPYDEEFGEVLWRTLVGNRDRFGNVAAPFCSCVLDSAILDPHHAPPPDSVRTNDYGVEPLHLWMRRNSDFVVHQGKPLKHFLRDNKMLDEQPELYQQCAARALEFFWYRRLITTERGYLGSAPRPVQRGDFVAVLLGCPAPLVLRRCPDGDGDTFEIVAECYLEGIMDGELAQGIDEGKYNVWEILIS